MAHVRGEGEAKRRGPTPHEASVLHARASSTFAVFLGTALTLLVGTSYADVRVLVFKGGDQAGTVPGGRPTHPPRSRGTGGNGRDAA